MALLVVHGCAGVLWQTPNQLLLYDIVGPADLPSAVRLNATRALSRHPRRAGGRRRHHAGAGPVARHHPEHAVLPADAAVAVLGARPAQRAPRCRASPSAASPTSWRPSRAIAAYPVLISMTLLAGLTSFLVGNAYNAQMPGFANDLGHGDPGVSYSMLLAADAAGALVAGFALEAWGRLRPAPRSASCWRCCGAAVAARLRVATSLPAGARAAVRRRLLRAVVQHDGAGAGPAERAGRDPRPRRRPLQHGRARHARLQRHHRRPGGRARSASTGRSACRPPCCRRSCCPACAE